MAYLSCTSTTNPLPVSFSSPPSFVPVSGIRLRADDETKPPFYETPYDKDQVKGAPVADIDRAPTEEEMDLLARHYGTNHQS